MLFDTSLTPDRRKLVRLMQEIDFGKVHHLLVRQGQPVFEPPPRIVREIKLHGASDVPARRATRGFALKAPLVNLFQYLDEVCNGTVLAIEVRHGLPFRLALEHVP